MKRNCTELFLNYVDSLKSEAGKLEAIQSQVCAGGSNFSGSFGSRHACMFPAANITENISAELLHITQQIYNPRLRYTASKYRAVCCLFRFTI